MNTEIVRIRLKPSTYLKYESAARLNDMPLSTLVIPPFLTYANHTIPADIRAPYLIS